VYVADSENSYRSIKYISLDTSSTSNLVTTTALTTDPLDIELDLSDTDNPYLYWCETNSIYRINLAGIPAKETVLNSESFTIKKIALDGTNCYFIDEASTPPKIQYVAMPTRGTPAAAATTATEVAAMGSITVSSSSTEVVWDRFYDIEADSGYFFILGKTTTSTGGTKYVVKTTTTSPFTIKTAKALIGVTTPVMFAIFTPVAAVTTYCKDLLTDPSVITYTSDLGAGSTLFSLVEGGTTQTFNAVLDKLPEATVSVILSMHDNLESTTATPLSFTTSNWDTPQEVVMRASADGVAAGSYTGNINFRAESTSDVYNGTNLPISTIPVQVSDGNGRKIFWTSYAQGFVARSNLDGTGVEILESQLASPQGLFVEELRQRLYWIDQSLSGTFQLNYKAWYSSNNHQWGTINSAASAAPPAPATSPWPITLTAHAGLSSDVVVSNTGALDLTSESSPTSASYTTPGLANVFFTDNTAVHRGSTPYGCTNGNNPCDYSSLQTYSSTTVADDEWMLALDDATPGAEVVYWVELRTQIWRAEISSSYASPQSKTMVVNIADLGSGTDNLNQKIRGVAVDSNTHTLYWASYNEADGSCPRIMRHVIATDTTSVVLRGTINAAVGEACADTISPSTIGASPTNSLLVKPIDIAVDNVGNGSIAMLYWIDNTGSVASGHKIVRVATDGTGSTNLEISQVSLCGVSSQCASRLALLTNLPGIKLGNVTVEVPSETGGKETVSTALRGWGMDATSGEKRKFEAVVELHENRSAGWTVVLGTDPMAVEVRTRPLADVTVTITAVHTVPCDLPTSRRRLGAWWDAATITAAGRSRCYMRQTNPSGGAYASGVRGYDGYGTATGDNSAMTVSPSTLIFTTTNWHVPQTVTVLAVDDSVAQGDRIVQVVHAATSGDKKFNDANMATLYATVLEDDVADIASRCRTAESAASCAAVNVGDAASAPGAALSGGGGSNSKRESVVVSVDENGAVRYDLKLASKPYDIVNVSFTAAHAGCTTAGGSSSSSSLCAATIGTDHSNLDFTPASMVFTPANWDVEQQLMVSAVDDYVSQGFRQPTIHYACNSTDARYNRGYSAYTSVTVNVTDDDVHGIGFNTMHVWATEHGQCRRQQTGCSMLAANCGEGLTPNRATNLISHIGRRPIMCNESGASTVALLRTCKNGGASLLCADQPEAAASVANGYSSHANSGPPFGYCKCLAGFYGYDCGKTDATIHDATASCAAFTSTGADLNSRGGYQMLPDPSKLGHFLVKLNSIPYHAVTIAVISTDPTQAFAQPSLLVFEGSDASGGLSAGSTGRDADHNATTAQSVWVFAQDDYVVEDPTNVTIMLQVTSSDPGYHDHQIPQNLSVTVRDDDAPRIRLSPASQGATAFHSNAHTIGSAPKWDQQLAAGVATTVGELTVGESTVNNVYVSLSSRPTSATGCETTCVGGAVTVGVHRYAHPDDHSEIAVSPSALTFTDSNWYVPQKLQVTAVDDKIYQFDRDTAVYFSVKSEDPFYAGANSYSSLGDLTLGVDFPAVNVQPGSVVQDEVFPSGNRNSAGSTNSGQAASKQVGTGTGADTLKLRVLEDDVAAVLTSRQAVTVIECEDRYGIGLNNYEAGVAICGGFPKIQNFTVKLRSRPYNPVTISLRVGNGGDIVGETGTVTTALSMVAGVQLGISPKELVFTGNTACSRGNGCGKNNTGDWDMGQTVLVIAAENVLDDGTRLVNVTGNAQSNGTWFDNTMSASSQSTATPAPTVDKGFITTSAPTPAGSGATFHRKSAYHRYRHIEMNATTKKAIVDQTRGATVPIVTARILDNEVAAVSIAPATHPLRKGLYHSVPKDIRVSLEEGETTEYLVRLSVRPSHLVTVTAIPSNREELSVLPKHLVFSFADYFEDKKFTVKAIANHVHESDRNRSVSHIVTSNSTKTPKCDYSVDGGGVSYLDPTAPCHIAYGGVPVGVVHVGIRDEDSSGVKIQMLGADMAATIATVSTDKAAAAPDLQGCVVEGASVRYTIALTSSPTANVTVSLQAIVDGWGSTTEASRAAMRGTGSSSSDVAEKFLRLDPSSITFTPTAWGGGKAASTTEATVVTVRAVDNEWYEGFVPKRFNVTHTAVSLDANYNGYPTYSNNTFAPTGAPTDVPAAASSSSSTNNRRLTLLKHSPLTDAERQETVHRSTVRVLVFDDDAGCRSDSPQYKCQGAGSECIAVTERAGSEGVYLRPARPPSECSLLLSTSFQSGEVCRCEKGRGGASCENSGSEYQRLVMMVEAGSTGRRRMRGRRRRLVGASGRGGTESESDSSMSESRVSESVSGSGSSISGGGVSGGGVWEMEASRRRLGFEVSFDNGRTWPALAAALGVDESNVYVLQVVDKPCVYDATTMCSEVMCDLSGEAAKIDVMTMIREDSPALNGLGIADVWVGPDVMPRGDEATDAVVRRVNGGSLVTLGSLTGTTFFVACLVACFMGRKKRWKERAEAKMESDEKAEVADAREKRMTERYTTTMSKRDLRGKAAGSGSGRGEVQLEKGKEEEPSTSLIPSKNANSKKAASKGGGIRKGAGVKKGMAAELMEGSGTSGDGATATDLLLE
jgi:hypothetical protein